ncbi:hypothetical protein LJC45_01950 [Alistipes sp. OttesenSCG-928-B03]|nr:hypothetical protein [Alistipes sp. OttesenSCG-928-B03]
MEIIETNPAPRRPRKPTSHSNVYIGAVFILAGIFAMLYVFDILPPHIYRMLFSWQMLIVAVGGYLLACRNWLLGSVVAGIGIFMFLARWIDLNIPFTKILLPAALIIIGIAFIMPRK